MNINLAFWAFHLRKYRVALITALVVLLFVFPIVITAYINALIEELPPIETLQTFTPALSSRVYDRNDRLITEFFTEKRQLTPLSNVSDYLKKALIAIEDTGFYQHYGFSPRGIVRAAVNNLFRRRTRGLQGGSTITQQLSKMIFLTRERTLERKLKELLMAIQLEQNLSKDEILEMYINQVYFGARAHGVEAASRVYFSKSPAELSLAEAAMLAGLVRAPNHYSPFRNPERTLRRRAVVLERMRSVGFISSEDTQQANEEFINAERTPIPSDIGPYFVEYVRIQLDAIFGADLIHKGGLSIYTTLDIDYQVAAENSFNTHLALLEEVHSIRRKLVVNGSTNTLQGALLATDLRTGAIRAMIGGRNFRLSQFNRATQALRQPGSSFKTLIYTAALENGFSPTTVLDDAPLVYLNDGRDWYLASRTTYFLENFDQETLEDPTKVWVPQNYKRRYHGIVAFRQAFEQSMNSVAIQILGTIGIDKAINYARRMGITSPLTNTLSLALGSSDVTLYEMTRAFSTLGNHGIRTMPYAIRKVLDKSGRKIFEQLPEEEETLSASTSFVMTNIMKGVIERGTARVIRGIGTEAAGKTGTTNDNTDTWFLGYTPEIACGVWVGFDDKISMGDGITGGRAAAPIWRDFIKNIPKENTTFSVPSRVVFVNIDPSTGLLADKGQTNAFSESFIAGTEPREYASQLLPEETEQWQIISEIEDDGEGF